MSQKPLTHDEVTNKFHNYQNLLFTTKFENISKEKLLKEYRILFYRSREVQKMLAEYH